MSTAHATLRASTINFGDREHLRGREVKTPAWVNLERSQALTIYVAAEVDAPPALLSRIRLIATIEWGHGGASITEDYPVARRLTVPLVGSMAKVTVRLVDVTGAPVPDTVTAACAAVIAPGLDPTRNTRWTATHGSSGLLSVRPERVVGVHGYNTAAVVRWIMFFDTRVVPVAGDVPVFSRPASLAAFDFRNDDGRPFYAGVTWGVSQDPITYAPDAAADVYIEVGFLL